MRMDKRWERFYNLILLDCKSCKVVWHGQPMEEGCMIGHSYFIELPYDVMLGFPKFAVVKA
jgi:hypothetical protein